MQVLKRFKSPSTALLSIPIASYCSIKRLLDKRLNSPQIPAFRMTTGIYITTSIFSYKKNTTEFLSIFVDNYSDPLMLLINNFVTI